MLPGTLERPTSVFLSGGPSPLLNWVAYGFAAANRGDYYWTDVRSAGEDPDPRGPIASRLAGSERFGAVPPERLAPQRMPEGTATAVRTTTSPDRLHESLDFFRLPEYSKSLILNRPKGSAAFLLVYSNVQRVAPYYPPTALGPLAEAVVRAGVSVIVTHADEVPDGRRVFRNSWQVHVADRTPWANAELEVEFGDLPGGLIQGAKRPLREIPQLRPLVDLLG